MVAIAMFIAAEYFFIGVVLAIWAAVAALVMPVVGLASYLALSPRLAGSRQRAIAVTVAIMVAIGGVLFLVPVPSWTNTQGVVSIPEHLTVRAGAEGFVRRVLVAPGTRVRRGEPLVDVADPVLESRLRVLQARVDELGVRYQVERVDKLVRAQMTLDQLQAAEAELARARERADDLVMRSPAEGVFALFAPQDLPGRLVKQGEQVGYVVADTRMTARVVVPQQSVELVRGRTERLSVKVAERLAETIPARVMREVPRASDRLPSPALSQAGGGDVALDPGGGPEMKTLQTHFEFEIELPADRRVMLGGRAYVRFDHVREPVAQQVWRWLRQQFLRRLAV
jgi:putative peptide zinc metalloprotease protein